MEGKDYLILGELLDLIDSPNRENCIKIYEDHKEMFDKAKGSNRNHQAWEGGYIGHITDVLNIAYFQWNAMNHLRELPFSMSDALLVLFLHDLEKPWKYAGNVEELAELYSYDDYQEFQAAKIKEYGFELTAEHLNGIKYAHGEGSDFTNLKKISTPLAAFIHCCDTMSARIWFDYPKEQKW